MAKKAKQIKKKQMKSFRKVRKATAMRVPSGQPKITKSGKRRFPIFSALGAGVGAYFGNPTAGMAIGSHIDRIFGSGSYKVKSNSLMNGGPPSFGSMKSGFRIRHREYISDVSTTTSFTASTYQLQPALSTSFPWLSTIAVNFEEYKIHGIVYYFNTTSATAVASTNTALGVVGMVTQYDPSDPAFTTKQAAEQYQGCVTSVPCQSLIHTVECAPKSNVLDRLYVRTNDGVSNEDLKFYDHGKFTFFTAGSQAGAVAGELWVSYDIEFFKPRLPNPQNTGATGMAAFTTTTASSTYPIGQLTSLAYGDVNAFIDDSGFLNIQDRPGNYLVLYSASTSSGSTTAPNIQPYANCTLYGSGPLFGSNHAPNANTNNYAISFAYFNCPAYGSTGVTVAEIQLESATLPTVISAALNVIRLPDSLDLSKLTKEEVVDNEVANLRNRLDALIKLLKPEMLIQQPSLDVLEDDSLDELLLRVKPTKGKPDTSDTKSRRK